MVQGKLYQKLKDITCHLKQLEPYTSWSNAAEGEIKELKKCAGCKLLKSRAQKHLCNTCLDLEAYIRYIAGHEIYKLDRDVFTTVMSGKTLNIYQFFELEWFRWVMF